MPAKRKWTVVLVPPRNESARSYEVPAWTFRAMAWAGGLSVLLVAAAVFVLFSPWGTPGARLVAAQNAALQQDIARIEERFRILDDTLRLIAERENQMRMLAGLPSQITVEQAMALIMSAGMVQPSPDVQKKLAALAEGARASRPSTPALTSTAPAK